MQIQNFGQNLTPERLFFARVMLDVESRALPDIGLYWTFNSGLRWEGEPVETLSAKMPTEGSVLNFGVIRKPSDAQLNALLVYTENGEIKWHQKFEVFADKVGNTSYEIMKKFLTVAGHIHSERQAVELMYPAYGLDIPLDDEPMGLHGNPKTARPLPDIEDIVFGTSGMGLKQ